MILSPAAFGMPGKGGRMVIGEGAARSAAGLAAGGRGLGGRGGVVGSPDAAK